MLEREKDTPYDTNFTRLSGVHPETGVGRLGVLRPERPVPVFAPASLESLPCGIVAGRRHGRGGSLKAGGGSAEAQGKDLSVRRLGD